jgi:hypothetical protein
MNANTTAEVVRVKDSHNPHKIHAFRFYPDYHVTYNQEICGKPFYRKWQRINKKFGYAEHLAVAKSIYKHTQFHKQLKNRI